MNLSASVGCKRLTFQDWNDPYRVSIDRIMDNIITV